MRIISGKYKGANIKAPSNIPSRPTTDMAKSGLFNILNNVWNFEAKSVLDLFSGTGNMAFEFSSRGCFPITCIEQNRICTQFIKKFSSQYKMEDFEVIQGDVFSYLKKSQKHFNIVFADPPYGLPTIKDIPQLVFENNLIKDQGWLIIETDDRTSFEDHPKLLQKRQYGGSLFWIFE